jgi:hypothetical protein
MIKAKTLETENKSVMMKKNSYLKLEPLVMEGIIGKYILHTEVPFRQVKKTDG